MGKPVLSSAAFLGTSITSLPLCFPHLLDGQTNCPVYLPVTSQPFGSWLGLHHLNEVVSVYSLQHPLISALFRNIDSFLKELGLVPLTWDCPTWILSRNYGFPSDTRGNARKRKQQGSWGRGSHAREAGCPSVCPWCLTVNRFSSVQVLFWVGLKK